MPTRPKRVNPFYVLLVLAGVAFCLTASAYGVMAVKQLHASQQIVPPSANDSQFMTLMDEHGVTALVVELVVLGIATAAAISTDRFWSGEAVD